MRLISALLFAVLCFTTENVRGYTGVKYIGRRSFNSPRSVVLGSTRMGHTQWMQAATLYKPPKYLTEVARSIPNNKLSISDVSFKSGRDLNTVSRDVMGLVAATGANILVTDKGDIMYEMPPNYERRILQRSLLHRMQVLCDRAYPPLLKIVKGGFAVMLFTSLIVMTTAIMALASAAGSSSRKDDGDNNNDNRSSSNRSRGDSQRYQPGNQQGYYRSSSRGPQVHAVIDIGQAIRFLTAKPPQSSVDSTQEGPAGMSFLDSFHSYVFGDADLNRDYSAQLSMQAARTIRQNGGVVVAEQLIPFLPQPPAFPSELLHQGTHDAESSIAVVQESYVLPIVLAFNGEPQVTANGNIVYRFTELMTTAHEDSLLEDSRKQSAMVLREHAVPFSSASPGQRSLAAALGVANLVLARSLGIALKAHSVWVSAGASVSVRAAPSWLGTVSKAYPLLLGYAVLYNAIPLGRFLVNWRRNAAIRNRNEQRALWANFSKNSRVVQAKLRDAKQHCVEPANREVNGSNYIGADPIIFSSTPAASLIS